MPMPMSRPRVSRSRRLGVLFIVSGSLYVVAFLLLIVVSERFLARVGRTPTLVSAAVAYALIVLALGAHTLRVRPAPFSVRRWVIQYFVLVQALFWLLGFVLAATFAYGLLWAAFGSLSGFFLMLWLVPAVGRWRWRGGGAREGGGQG
jgi:hypothetical protein